MEFFDSLRDVKKEMKPYKEWDKKWDDKEAQRKALHKKIDIPKDQFEKAEALGKTIIKAVEVMDENSEENTENVESITEPLTGIAAIFGLYLPMLGAAFLGVKNIVKPKTAIITGIVGAGVGFFGSLIGSVLYGTHLQKMASRISHYQSQKELEDPKNFVAYDKAQVEEAEKIAQKMPDEKKKRFLGIFGKKDEDKKGYWASIKSLVQDHKKYEEWNKNKDKNFDISNVNPTQQQMKDAKADQDVIFRVIKNVNEKAEDYSENMETTANVLLGSSFLGGGALGSGIAWVLNKTGGGDQLAKLTNSMAEGIKNNNKNVGEFKKVFIKLAADGMKTPVARIKAIGIMSSMLASIAVIPVALKLQKNSARIGRYIAKKELEQDPKNFVYYDDQQMEQAKDVKSDNKKGLISRLIQDIKFAPKIIKEAYEYDKYKKTTLKEKKKLRKALKEVEVRPEQLEKAKNIQHKVFKSFDKIDEMSQRYSEDVESATNIAMQSMPILAYFSFLSPFALLAYGIFTGKINPGSVAQKASGLFAKCSSLLTTKPVKKVVNEVSDKVNDLGKLIPKNEEDEILGMLVKNVSKENLVNFFENFKNVSKINIKELCVVLPKNTEDVITYFEKNAPQIEKIADNLQKIVKKLPDDEFSRLVNTLAENPQAIGFYMKNPDLLGGLLSTPTVKNIGKTAAISWAGMNIGAMYLIQLYLSQLQKQGGKVGTMKAIQSLEDPRHFVDIYSSGQPTPQAQPAGPKPSNSVLERYMQIKNQAV